MNWVAENHVSPAVASMSLGGGFSQAINDAIATMHDAGVVVTTAAGNSNADACGFSPASAAKSFTVASMTSTDVRSSFSNYGSCTNMYAPGSSILSAWIGGVTATNTISGTSMATPHVAGAMAVFRSMHPTASPDDVWRALENVAAVDKIADARPGSPNLLLQAVGFCDETTTPGPHQDCVLSEWSAWSACTIPAGACDGTRTRTRTVFSEATGCGTCPSNLQETEMCMPETPTPECITPEPTQFYPNAVVPTATKSVLLAPNASGSAMAVVCQETFATFPVDPSGHTPMTAQDDGSFLTDFPQGKHFTFFGNVYQRMYVGTNGYITFGQIDSSYNPAASNFFSHPRIGALMTDLNPSTGGSVRVGFEQDRAVVTWLNVPYYGQSNSVVNVQVELIFDSDEVRITYGEISVGQVAKLSGVSSGNGIPM
eukprot:1173777-Prorocentrum_minimum.AAC.1